ncbi:MAG: hypothetical protein CSB55_01090 [Candidatus Cloacimonadota bacterium]|nr:MAG: hypothetical protein CSB55_01090 [Candidatus Cloacimonadota bacterium]
MKKIFFLTFMLFLSYSLFSIKNWKIYTNTTHITDFIKVDNRIYIATWGGLEVFNEDLKSFTENYTALDGLNGIDLTSLMYDKKHREILIGSYKNEVASLKNGTFQYKINSDMGLVSPYIRKLIYHKEYILVCTEEGLSIFQYLDGINFPVLLKNCTLTQNLADNFIVDAVVTDNDVLLVGTVRGLNYGNLEDIINGVSFDLLDESNSPLPSDEINCLYHSQGVTAVGTKSGLAIIDDSDDFSNWIVKEDVLEGEEQSILPVFIDNSGNIYCSGGNKDYSTRMYNFFGDHDLYVFSGDNFENKKTIDIGTDKISAIKYAGDKIAVGTWGEGLFINEEDDWVQYLSNSVSSNLITRIKTDKDGMLWVASGYKGQVPSFTGTQGISCFDGENWTTYNIDNSPIRSNNIYSMAFDSKNNAYFGCFGRSLQHGWKGAVSILSPDGIWGEITRSDGLMHEWVSDISVDSEDNVWVSCMGEGGRIDIFNPVSDLDNPVKNKDFIVPWSTEYGNDPFSKYFFENEIIFGGIATGAKIYHSRNIDEIENMNDWEKPAPSDLRSGFIYGVEKIYDNWGNEEMWFASSSGIFIRKISNPGMPNEAIEWFKLGIGVKRFKLRSGTTNQWDKDTFYIVGEPRLFGAVSSTPSAMIKDSFNRIWIGTTSSGLTVYDPETELYSNYSSSDYPMLSDNILSLGYVKESGLLFFGTDKGLMSVDVGTNVKINEKIDEIKVFPNPFYPEKGEIAVISNFNSQNELTSMPKGKNICRIYDMSGQLAVELKEDKFLQFSWNGKNNNGADCGSGVYFFIITDSKGNSFKGKIALIR